MGHAANERLHGSESKKSVGPDRSTLDDRIDEFLDSLIQPAQQQGFDFSGDSEGGIDGDKEYEAPICDESHLQIFRFWYQMGGLRRPLTPVEAAETPAPLAMDFIYLLRRLRLLKDVQAGVDEFLQEKGMYKPEAEHGGPAVDDGW